MKMKQKVGDEDEWHDEIKIQMETRSIEKTEKCDQDEI
jgi:hypothetical protein